MEHHHAFCRECGAERVDAEAGSVRGWALDHTTRTNHRVTVEPLESEESGVAVREQGAV